MGAAREKDQADFDLESFIELFDEALTSDDPSVQKTLQHLMVICALARNHQNHNPRSGPLRRLFDDMRELHRRLERLETGNSTLGGGYRAAPMPGTPAPIGPTIWPPIVTQPGTASPNWPGYPGPTPIWTSTTAASVTLPENSAVAQSAGTTIAERVDDLLKSNYKGSSVGTLNVKIA
jgi:hypothetical protein